MRILILNGSPKSERSATLKLTKAFAEGLKQDGDIVDTIDLSRCDVQGCRGCYSCWATGGICVIKDDVPRLQEDFFFKADIVIWSFPLFFYSVPSRLKAFMDRLFLNDCPDIEANKDGRPTHPERHDTSRMKHVVISTCGFHTAQGLYDSVLPQFRLIYGDRFAGAITCPEGALFALPGMEEYSAPYLERVRAAGRSFSEEGRITDETSANLAEPILSAEAYMNLLNNFDKWQHKNTYSKD